MLSDSEPLPRSTVSAPHHGLEIDEHAATGNRRLIDVLAVDPHLLPGAVIPITPRKRGYRVRERHVGKAPSE